MGTIMIRCPQTGRTVSTGLRAERETYQSSAVFFSRTFCPFCRVTHEWFASDAWLQEQAPHSTADRSSSRAAAG